VAFRKLGDAVLHLEGAVAEQVERRERLRPEGGLCAARAVADDDEREELNSSSAFAHW